MLQDNVTPEPQQDFVSVPTKERDWECSQRQVQRLQGRYTLSINPANRAALRGNSEMVMNSWTACAPSPTPPRPSRVGIPSPAVKFPSEPPPTAASLSFQPSSLARTTARS